MIKMLNKVWISTEEEEVNSGEDHFNQVQECLLILTACQNTSAAPFPVACGHI